MKAQSRTKQIVVSYKGWHAVQSPWNSCFEKQYAKYIYNPDGKLVLHAGCSKHCTRKELKLMLMDWARKNEKENK